MSLFDEIPDEELVKPVRVSARIQKKGVNLTRTRCAQCGEEFERHTGYTRYERTVQGRTMRFCSWTCLCAFDRTKKHVERRGRPAKPIQERIDTQTARLEADRRLLEQTTDKKRRSAIQDRIYRRRKAICELIARQVMESGKGQGEA